MTDVVLVSLGSTLGLREADEQLAGALRRAGAEVVVATAAPQGPVRTMALTDLRWALAARRAAADAIARERPRAVLYSMTTAALLWPRAGGRDVVRAIRFDALAADNRPGRHGIWQRPLERRRLRQAAVLVASSPHPELPSAIVVPTPVEPSGAGAADAAERDVAAVTYGANPEKKGLDRVLKAWARARRDSEELVVVGTEGGVRPGVPDGVRFAGRLAPEEYRALLRRARAFVAAPRREDYGIAQLEALADGCLLVTTPAPGPYAALPIARALDPRLVPDGPDGLAAAIRAALDDPGPGYAERALAALAPYRAEAVDRVVAERLLPALLGS
ncbi:MAG TPA: glycosyltransferase [Solirubrobacteraceae bacterium]|nr:glycosyltransferase [Solirubrobacteraceae bacterium]